MAWIYFQESEESHAHSGDGLDPSPTVKTTDTLKACCLAEWLMDHCQLRPSGMTSPRSEPNTCLEELTSSTAVFPVRTSRLQATELASQASVQDWSVKYGDWLMKYDRVTSSWRMSQPSLMPDWIASLPRLPNAGLMRSGYVFQRQRLEHVTTEIDGGYLPTPIVGRHCNCSHIPRHVGGSCRPGLQIMAERGLIPTPTVDGNYNRKGSSPTSADGLVTALARNDQLGGRLSPLFVEQMMGYSIGWTDLSASVTQWFRSARKKRSKGSQDSVNETQVTAN